MTKIEFISQLRNGLADFPEKDLERYIDYYSEIIDDKIEDGMSEKKALESIGTPEEVISKILNETPLPKLVKNKIKPKRKLSTFELLLIIAGSPVWISLLAAAASVIIAILASIVSVIISLWAANLAFALSGIVGVVGLFFFLSQGNPAAAFFVFGCGLFLAGTSVFIFCGLKSLTVYTVKSCKQLTLNLKRSIIKKEENK